MRALAMTNTQIDIDKDYFYRIFETNVDDEELVWHRDHRDRTCYVVEGEGWKIQFDNKNPVDLKEGDFVSINSMDYHRLLKGSNRLVLKIMEH